MSEPGPFRSLEEAYAFVKSHEIATNNKYVVAKNKAINKQDLTSLDSYKVKWEYTPGVRAGSERIDDGIPFINLGVEIRSCQYGPPRKRDRDRAQAKKDSENQEGTAAAEISPLTGSAKKRRRTQPSKKLNCQSKLKIKKIMKFPEYAVDVEKGYPATFKNELGRQLKATFSENTKRYILIYVHTENNHNHEAMPLEGLQKHKEVVHVVDKGCTRIPKVTLPNLVPKRAPLLKHWASLKGKNLMDLAMQFKTAIELPTPLAQPKPNQKLEDMNDEELLSLYHDITGEMPNDMFSIANKEFSISNLHLLLHLCIVFANAASEACRQSQTHPSVRIKGTESNFTPVHCLEIDCAIVEPHMHCPLCAKTDSYTDPALLKKHFTTKHVDKAIEFAGLKILRCYDICEVAGKNKEWKTFKGGHWHCYKCPNGLDKRNSALTHYRAHLKNYDSSFQIQVAQDLNPSMCGFTVPHEIEVSHVPWESYQMSGSLNAVSTTTKPVGCSSPLKRSYADTNLGDLETIDHTTMYVHDDGIGNVTSTYTAQEIPTTGNETYVITVPDSAELVELKDRVRELEMNCKELEKKNAVQKSHIEFLQKKDEDQTKLIDEYKAEKQDFITQIERQKLDIEILKATQISLSQPPEKGPCSSKKNPAIKSPRTVSVYQVPSDVEVSLNKSKELEKSQKNCKTVILRPSYGTRGSARQYLTRISSDDKHAQENLSKEKTEILTGSQTASKSVEGSGTSQQTTMEEMCSQLSNMRQEIELLKQTSLARNTVDMQNVTRQPSKAASSALNMQINNSKSTRNQNRSDSSTAPANSTIVVYVQDKGMSKIQMADQNNQNIRENVPYVSNASVETHSKGASSTELVTCSSSGSFTNTGVSSGAGNLIPGSVTLAPRSSTSIPGSVTLASIAGTSIPGSVALVSSAGTSISGSVTPASIAGTSKPGSVTLVSRAVTSLPGSVTLASRAGTSIPGSVTLVSRAGTSIPSSVTLVSRAGTSVPGSVTLASRAGTVIPGSVTLVSRADTSLPGSVTLVSRAGTSLPGSVTLVSRAGTSIPSSVQIVSKGGTSIPGSVTLASRAGTSIPGSVTLASRAGTAIPGSVTLASRAGTSIPGSVTIASRAGTSIPGSATLASRAGTSLPGRISPTRTSLASRAGTSMPGSYMSEGTNVTLIDGTSLHGSFTSTGTSVISGAGASVPSPFIPAGTGATLISSTSIPGRTGGNMYDLCAAAGIIESSLPSDS